METSAKRAQMIHDTLHDQSQAGHDERAIVAQIEKLKPRFGEKDVRELINDLEAQREAHVKLRESLERFKINMARLNASLGLMRTRLIEMSAAEEATLQRELAEQAREIRDRTERFTRVLLETSDEAGRGRPAARARPRRRGQGRPGGDPAAQPRDPAAGAGARGAAAARAAPPREVPMRNRAQPEPPRAPPSRRRRARCRMRNRAQPTPPKPSRRRPTRARVRSR